MSRRSSKNPPETTNFYFSTPEEHPNWEVALIAGYHVQWSLFRIYRFLGLVTPAEVDAALVSKNQKTNFFLIRVEFWNDLVCASSFADAALVSKIMKSTDSGAFLLCAAKNFPHQESIQTKR